MSAYTFTINEQTFNVEIGSIQGNIANVTVNEVPYKVRIDESSSALAPAAPMNNTRPAPKMVPPRPVTPVSYAPKPQSPKPAPAAPPKAVPNGDTMINAPIPGKIISINVKEGEAVAEGQVVVVIEAMKMENTITSPVDGVVKKMAVHKDAEISTDDLIMIIG